MLTVPNGDEATESWSVLCRQITVFMVIGYDRQVEITYPVCDWSIRYTSFRGMLYWGEKRAFSREVQCGIKSEFLKPRSQRFLYGVKTEYVFRHPHHIFTEINLIAERSEGDPCDSEELAFSSRRWIGFIVLLINTFSNQYSKPVFKYDQGSPFWQDRPGS
jgi:hypothetical protein